MSLGRYRYLGMSILCFVKPACDSMFDVPLYPCVTRERGFGGMRAHGEMFSPSPRSPEAT